MEHLPVVEKLSGFPVRPELLRRNIGVEGINLMALRLAKKRFRIGSVILQATGTCHPCQKMNTTRRWSASTTPSIEAMNAMIYIRKRPCWGCPLKYPCV